jgi:heme exporter protein D
VVGINPAASENSIRLRWVYFALPVALFLLTIILAVCFYPFLSSEVAYHFNGDFPDKWISRGGFIAWMIIPQFVFTIIAIAVVRLVMLSSRNFPKGTSPLHDILPIMGNMLALPQLVIIFAMVSFFVYNAYQIRLISLWLFILIVLVIGGIILALLFMRAIRRARRRQANFNQELSNARKK